jgi:CSLREA domain-containing protein
VNVAAAGLALLVALVGGPGPFAPGPVGAVGLIIQVTTSADAEFPVDGLCSLRAAILAANVGGFAGYCSAGTAERDSIRFALGSGTPQINLGSNLPTITQAVTISGSTGGATRVRLHGPGGGTGLTVNGADTTIRNLVVDNFNEGIHVGTTGVTIVGSIIGPNVSFGINADTSTLTVGGTTGVTPGGTCTGDCNRIIGNGAIGLRAVASSGTVVGNMIGTDETGTLAVGNDLGVFVSGGTWSVGGTAAGAGNLISGNGDIGMELDNCSNCTIQGNRIGTNVAGNASLHNSGPGVWVFGGSGMVIGGTAPGAGNLVSGNAGLGIRIDTNISVTIQGNRIGTTATGGPLGNGGDGIQGVGYFALYETTIGSASDPAGANVIANNAGAGIDMTSSDNGTPLIRGNSIYDNAEIALDLKTTGPAAVVPPAITGLKPLHGTSCSNCLVDIFSDDADEARVFEGTATADGMGNWTYPDLFAGPNITATATDGGDSTSKLSAPFAPTTPFTDIAGSLFAKEITWAYANGIAAGCTPTKYCPTGPVTREQMASFLWRMFDLPLTVTDYFTDDQASIHEDQINALAASGITSGCTATKFCPTANVLRDQMASFLARADDLSVGAGRDYFNDDDGNIHEANIDRNAAAGLTTGCVAYKYCPSGSVTREQMAAFLRRILAPVASPPYPAP